jgi:hypothetical protein
MVPADKIVSDTTLHFCLMKKHRWDEILAVRGGYGYIMVKLIGYRPGLWVVLLQVSWAWKLAMFHQKMSQYYVKKNPSSIPSCAPKIPYIFLKYPSKKWGM